MASRILYVVTEDWYFLSHRLPMARAAAAAGYEVHIATRFEHGRAKIEEEGFICHELSWSRGSLSARDSLGAVRQLRQLYRNVQPDIVHNVSMKPILLGSAARLGLAPSVVNSLTGVGSLFIGEAAVSGIARRSVRIVMGFLLRQEKTVTIVQNPDDQAFVRGLGVEPDHVVLIRGSGVDTDRLVPFPEPPPPITAAYVGRMLVDKGLPTLIEAFSILTRQGFPLRLILAGDCDPQNPGSLAPEQLREWAVAYGIDWLGQVEDIRTVWREAHFAVLASRREGLPKSLLEAAACGRAMVATDAPGCREIAVDGVTAITVPVDDAEALAEAMQRMATNHRMRQTFAKSARELVEREFSASAIGCQTVAVYDRLMKARQCS